MITLFSHMLSVHPKSNKTNNFQVRIVIFTGWTVGLAYGIIDDSTSLVEVITNIPSSDLCNPLTNKYKAIYSVHLRLTLFY